MLNVDGVTPEHNGTNSPLKKKRLPSEANTNISQFGWKPTELKQKVDQLVEENILPNLEEFVRIPNLSRNFDQDFLKNGLLEKASNFVVDWARKQGLNGFSINIYEEEGRTPLVFGVVEASPGIDTNILMYGHIDKQPHLDADWDEGLSATNPVRRGDRIYGRGISDDGYAPFASISIIKMLQEQKLPHPRVVMFFENDEESGSHDISFWIDKFSEQIGKPNLLVCLDSGCYDYDHWYITSTLRGCTIFELSVEVMQKGMHSGAGGGIIPDTTRIARILLNRIQDDQTGKIFDGLQVKIPGKTYNECEQICDILGKKFNENYKVNDGVKLLNEDVFENYLNRSQRPTMTIIGVDGLPDCKSAGNVIMPKTTFKVSCRLPPTLDPKIAEANIREVLTKDVPYNAKVEVKFGMSGQGFAAPAYPSHLDEILQEAAFEAFDNRPPLFNHEGGSIPFMNLLREKFPESFFMVTGLLGPDSNAHAGNEMLHIPMLKKLLHGMTRFTQNIVHVDFDYKDDKRQRLKSSKL